MPVVSFQQCLEAPVYTKMGVYVGRLIDIDFDVEGLQAVHFFVRPKGIFGFIKKPLMIHHSQVLECTKKRIIVEDGVIPEGGRVSHEPA